LASRLARHQAYEVFTSLLPDDEPCRAVGKTLWEALRNGLAHNFRPDTIKIDNDEWRFSISSGRHGSHIDVRKGQPNWIDLNIRSFSMQAMAQIDAYEKELRENPAARVTFNQQSKKYIRTIPSEATRIADVLRSHS
jgi:hypothetical protein